MKISEQLRAGARYMPITIPACEEHCGLYALTVSVPWTCLICGGPRGEPYQTISYDGSRRLGVSGWVNPCGHIEKYSLVRDAVAALEIAADCAESEGR